MMFWLASCQPAFAQTKVDGSLLKGDVIGGTASNNRRIVVPKDTKANLDAKTRLEANLVYGTDTKKAYIDNGTDLVAVGSGSGGAVNLITDGDAENAISSIFVPYNDGGVAFPIDGTGGSPTVTTSITSTNPLTGAKSYLLTKPASVVQGQGWSIPFTVDPSYRAKVLKISVDYIVNSGTFTAGSSLTYSDIIWYVYDITNSTLIEPSSIKMLSNSSTLSDKFEATFQTSATGSSYRLIAHMATGFSTAFELKVDNITVSPSVYVYGTPITDWQSYTPTFTNFGTVTGASFTWRRVGSSAEIRGVFTTGTTVAAEARISLPSGLTSASNLPTLSKVGDMGNSVAEAASFQVNIEPSITYLTMGKQSAGSVGFTKGNGNSWSSSTAYSLVASVPIQGWSSSVQMSDQTDTRVVAASYYGHNSTSFADNTYTTIQFNTKLEDTHSMYSAGTTTIKVAGIYEINAAAAFVIGGYGANNIFNLRVRVNGSTDYLLDRLIYTTSVQPNVTKGSIRLPLKVGDTVVIQVMKTNFGANSGFDADLTQTRMSIVRVSGPSAIAATETVACSYSLTGTQSAAHNVVTTVVFNNKIFDTHGALNTSTGIFTAPISGKYRVSGRVRATIGTGVSYTQQAIITTTGTGGGTSDIGAVSPAGFSVLPTTNITETVSLNAGQTVKIDFYHFNSASAAVTIQTNSNISIERVGN